MKSVLGLIGSAVLVVSCGGNSGNALFDDVGGAMGTGAAAGSSHGGNTNGGSSGGAGATTSGGSGQNGGMSGGGTAPNGGNGAGGDANGGDGGDTTGPVTPEAIYVATTGNDSADCGLTSADPCQTISQGVTRGVQAARASVYVQAGSYPGVVVLAGGISVVGGFDDSWQSGAHTDAGHQVIIQGGLEAQSQEYVAVWAHDLAESAALQNLEIDAPDAVGQKPGSRDGRSSYGIHAVAAKVALKDIDIKAGKGAKGAVGADGQDAVATAVVAVMNGGVGGNGVSTDAFCSVEQSLGGPAGTNSCSTSPSNVVMTGGKGGDGGARDQSCSGQLQSYDYTAQPGGKGADAAVSSGQTGKGGSGGFAGDSGKSGGPTMPGSAGAFQNGAKGSKAATGGKLVGSFWYANPGGDGTTGDNGTGGGGGGGGGGCDLNFNGMTDVRGAAGGGGGAGGCAARSGGGGGGGGGSSFGIFAVGCSVSVSNVNISRGSAADGGAGGVGGQGQSGGVGQSGGALHPNSAAAGKGGDGAHGGHGGGGAGGNGGSAFGIALDGASKLSGAATITGGAAGKGGGGGGAAPNAPALERDGNNGDDGNDGALAETFDF